jgi:hypothetical protein
MLSSEGIIKRLEEFTYTSKSNVDNYYQIKLTGLYLYSFGFINDVKIYKTGFIIEYVDIKDYYKVGQTFWVEQLRAKVVTTIHNMRGNGLIDLIEREKIDKNKKTVSFDKKDIML